MELNTTQARKRQADHLDRPRAGDQARQLGGWEMSLPQPTAADRTYAYSGAPPRPPGAQAFFSRQSRADGRGFLASPVTVVRVTRLPLYPVGLARSAAQSQRNP
uniref:Uncharacterized protein n=1 Tax=Oryza meridionalis TaxID=40149 RepID=A0A0E0CV94_9ORYZ